MSKAGFSVAQIEWEIRECDRIGGDFHRAANPHNSGRMIKNPPKDAFSKGLRPLLRWFNIVLRSLSYSFPELRSARDFDKVIAQKINE